MSISHDEWSRRYRILADKVDSIRKFRRAEACRLLKGVGMSDGQSLCMCSVHNCAISNIGNGWGWHPDGSSAARARRAICRKVIQMLNDGQPYELLARWDRRVRGLRG